MKNFTRISIFVMLMIVLVGHSMAKGNGTSKSSTVSELDKRKASYIFTQAHVAKGSDSIAAYFDLIKYAHKLDPTNTAAAYYYGYLLILKDNATDSDRELGISLMKDHVDAHPEDYYEASYFSDVCMASGHQDLGLEVVEKLAELNPTKTEVQMRLATAYVRNNKYEQALEAYKRIEEFEGESLETTAYKAALYSEIGDTLGAIEQMRHLYNSVPSNVNYNLVMSEMFLQFGMQDSALYYLDRAQELEPNNGNVYFSKAQYYDALGDSVNFDKQIYNALVAPGLDVDTKIDVLTQYTSTQLMRNDSTDRVNNLFKVLIDQHPLEPKVHELYSMYFSTIKDYNHATEELGYVIDLDPTNGKAWQRLMVVNVLNDNYPNAIEAAKKALEFNPDDMDLYRYIAPLYTQIKEYDKAIETYDDAMTKVDSVADAELYSSLLGGKGDVYVELGDSLRAFQLYDDALRIFPSNTSVMNNYAYFLSLNEQDLDKAESMAAKAVNANPNNATFIDTYAWVYFKKKNYDMALFYIKSAMLNADEPSSDIIEHYGDILFMTGDKDEAVKQWEKALELSPDSEILKRKVENKTYYDK